MITDLSKFINFLVKYEITAHEFMLPYMLYLDGVEKAGKKVYPTSGSAMANILKYRHGTRGWTLTEMQHLEEKNLITGLV